MKKTFIFGLIAAALGFTACSSEDDLMVNNQNNHKGMVLRATVEQPAESRATFTDNEGVWQFAFATDDQVSVTNTAISDFYTFTNNGTEFASEEAKTTETDATWYAYFPSNEVSLVGQSGTKADVANKYALAGATASATTGKGGLSITMSPKVAILVINNQIGKININVKNGPSTWVSGLTANADGFNVTTSTTKQNLLSVTSTGTYYIAVPAGIQISVKDGNKTIKSTGTNGLTAGKYYNLTLIGYGAATQTGGTFVNWIQLWAGGPKFAEYNIGATSASENGGHYCWGKIKDCDKNKEYLKGSNALTGTDDTATNLWGSNWRMPTYAELKALLDNCTCIWDNTNKGLLFTGKGDYSSNSVFFPAAGKWDGSKIASNGSVGHYWSSTPGDVNSANYLYLTSSNQLVSSGSSKNRDLGCSVRAVLK